MDSCLQELQDAISSASTGMSLEELTRHPEGKWSAAEVLEHLYLTYTGTLKGLERCLQEGKPRARRATLKDRLRTVIVVEFGRLPEGRKAPPRTTPQGMPAEQVVKAIGAEIAAMDDAFAQCEIRFGKRTKLMDHPILGPLTVRQWRKFHWVHGRHHVRQIWKLRGDDRRPQ